MVLSKKISTIRTGCCRAHAKYLQTTEVKTIWVCVYNALWCALRWGILCVNFWTQQHVEQQWCNEFSVVTFIIWALCNACHHESTNRMAASRFITKNLFKHICLWVGFEQKIRKISVKNDRKKPFELCFVGVGFSSAVTFGLSCKPTSYCFHVQLSILYPCSHSHVYWITSSPESTHIFLCRACIVLVHANKAQNFYWNIPGTNSSFCCFAT